MSHRAEASASVGQAEVSSDIDTPTSSDGINLVLATSEQQPAMDKHVTPEKAADNVPNGGAGPSAASSAGSDSSDSQHPDDPTQSKQLEHGASEDVLAQKTATDEPGLVEGDAARPSTPLSREAEPAADADTVQPKSSGSIDESDPQDIHQALHEEPENTVSDVPTRTKPSELTLEGVLSSAEASDEECVVSNVAGTGLEDKVAIDVEIGRSPLDYPTWTPEQLDQVLAKLLRPKPTNVYDDPEGCLPPSKCCAPCRLQQSNLLALEWALHTAFTTLLICIFLFVAPQSVKDIIAPVPFVLPVFGIAITPANFGGAIKLLILVPLSLVVSIALIAAVTLPLYCTPIALAILFFPALWLCRYFLNFLTEPVVSKFVSAVFVITALRCILEAKYAEVNGEVCEYDNWTPRLYIIITLLAAGVFSFVASFLPLPRCNFADVTQLNRRILRDAVTLVKHSLAVFLIQHHRRADLENRAAIHLQRRRERRLASSSGSKTPAFRKALESDDEDDEGFTLGGGRPSSNSGISDSDADVAEVHHVQVIEEVLEHLDDDLTAIGPALKGSRLECDGCQSKQRPHSLLGATESDRVTTIARHAYSILRTTVDRSSGTFADFEGRQLQNFSLHSGHVYQQMQERQRDKQLKEVRTAAAQSWGFREDGSSVFRTSQASTSTNTDALDLELLHETKPALLRLIAFLDSDPVRQQWSTGCLLTSKQSAQAASIAEDMVSAVSKRRRQLMLRSESAVGFDIIAYLAIGQRLLSIVNFVRALSSHKMTSRGATLPSGDDRTFCPVVRGLVCGSLGSACSGVNVKKLKQSFSASVAIYAAAMFFIVPQLMEYDPPLEGTNNTDYFDRDKYNVLLYNAIWAPLTIVFIAGGTLGGSFSTAILRFFGTVTGALGGSMIAIFMEGSAVGATTGLVAWVFLCSLFCRNEKYHYAGKVAAFTAAVIVFGNGQEDSASQPSTYAMSRMSQTFIGILIYLLATSLIFPASARDEGVEILRTILTTLQKEHNAAFALFDKCFFDDAPHASELVKREQSRQKLLQLLASHAKMSRQVRCVRCCKYTAVSMQSNMCVDRLPTKLSACGQNFTQSTSSRCAFTSIALSNCTD